MNRTTAPTSDPVAYKLGPVQLEKYQDEVKEARELRAKAEKEVQSGSVRK